MGKIEDFNNTLTDQRLPLSSHVTRDRVGCLASIPESPSVELLGREIFLNQDYTHCLHCSVTHKPDPETKSFEIYSTNIELS